MKLKSEFFLKGYIAAALAFTGITAHAQKAADLFADATAEQHSARRVVDSDILKRRAVRVNLNHLAHQAHEGGRIQINLFEGLSFEGVVEKVENRSKRDYTLSGHLNDDALSSFVLSVNEGGLVMNVRTKKGGFYQVRDLGDGLHEVRQLDETKFPPCGTTEAQAVFAPAGRVAADQPPQGDVGNIVDVMVVYTSKARIAAMPAGTLQQQVANMSNLINTAVSESNTAYQHSLITLRIRLVYQGEVSYTESGDFSTDLSRLTNPSDGYMDVVHTLRNTYGADLVSLWIDNSQYCGLGYLMSSLSPSFESSAFSTAYWDCATGYYSFAHEMGHNMGCQHDRENSGTCGLQPCQGLYPYSFGWRFTGNSATQYRTVMSYSPGTRIDYFSNPNVNYDGVPTGVAIGPTNQSYNAQTINNSAFTVANFRQTVNLPPVIDLQPQPQNVTIGAIATFTVSASGSTPMYYYWRKGGINISGATTNNSYSITNSQVGDANNYSVLVSNIVNTVLSSNAALTVVPPIALGEALDATGYIWNSGGTAPWTGQAGTTHDGTDAAQSGVIGNSQDSWVEATFIGPGTLTYWCKVSSENNYDLLRFYANGIQQGTSLSGEVNWVQRTASLPAGSQVCRWTYSKDNIDLDPVGQDRAWVDQVSFTPAVAISLPTALDNAGLNWTTGGNGAWLGQSSTTHDGVDAAESGFITDSQLTTLQTTVVGPGTLSFWWKVSSEQGYDFLNFLVGSTTNLPIISGEVDWTLRSVSIPAGTNVLTWKYSKDSSLSVGQDKGWVDQIVYSAASSFATNSTRMTNGQFQLPFNGFAGASYTLQASTNLTNWAALTNVVSSNTSNLFLDTGSTNFKNRFYRIVSP